MLSSYYDDNHISSTIAYYAIKCSRFKVLQDNICWPSLFYQYKKMKESLSPSVHIIGDEYCLQVKGLQINMTVQLEACLEG